MLKQEGYLVLEARDGIEALQLCESHSADIQALVTDVVMPRMGGIELARRVRESWPEVRVLFQSGHSEEGATLPGAGFLQKPFSQEQLAATLAELPRLP
jgi:CheY-like chemotaxis protein